jgi:hypothetical protein
MPGLVPGIHALLAVKHDAAKRKTWMAGTSPAMTGDERLRIFTGVSSIFGRVEGTTATFHIKLFHAKQNGFQGLRKLHE